MSINSRSLLLRGVALPRFIVSSFLIGVPQISKINDKRWLPGQAAGGRYLLEVRLHGDNVIAIVLQTAVCPHVHQFYWFCRIANIHLRTIFTMRQSPSKCVYQNRVVNYYINMYIVLLKAILSATRAS